MPLLVISCGLVGDIYFYRYLSKKIDFLEDEIKSDPSSYSQIRSFQTVSGKIDTDVVNPGDPVWKAGLITVFWDEDPNIIEERLQNLRSKLRNDGYKLQQFRYATSKDPLYLDYYRLPVVITMDHNIYPLMEIDYFERRYGWETRTHPGKFILPINELDIFPSDDTNYGYGRNYDLICELGYIVSRRANHTPPYFNLYRQDYHVAMPSAPNPNNRVRRMSAEEYQKNAKVRSK